VPEATGRAVYRIVQEGLTNARKHAHGAEVTVTVLGAAGPGLSVEIRNPCPDGPAGSESAGPEIPGAGVRIAGLAERAQLAGGRLEYGRLPGGDFRLLARLPWPR